MVVLIGAVFFGETQVVAEGTAPRLTSFLHRAIVIT
jgi:hypothetical protein